MKVVDGGSRKLHIERVGFPPSCAPELSVDDRLLLIAAAETLTGKYPAAPPAGEQPTAEEMLAIGMAIGMYEAERARRIQPPALSAWRLAARLGL